MAAWRSFTDWQYPESEGNLEPEFPYLELQIMQHTNLILIVPRQNGTLNLIGGVYTRSVNIANAIPTPLQIHEASDEFGGPKPFSEPQTRIVKDVVANFRPQAFVNLHSGEWAMYIPWDSKKEVAENLPVGSLNCDRLSSQSQVWQFKLIVAKLSAKMEDAFLLQGSIAGGYLSKPYTC